MLYRNDSAEALTALERQRLGNYGYDYEEETKVCPHCGYTDPEEFYMLHGDCIGCSGCISRVEWEDYEG